MAPRLLVAMRDPVLLSRLVSLAARGGFEIVADASESISGDAPGAGATPETPSRQAPPADVPVVAVAELELAGAVERIAGWRLRWPDALVAASIRIPDQELWHGALAAGADLVANRGSFAIQLQRAIDARNGGPGATDSITRLPVRLTERTGDGLVGRLPDAPGGSIAVFRVGDQLWAIRDECPHAGASLADGVLEGTVITCPRHGSQFDVTTGARERGPSDFSIRTYRVRHADGETWVEAPG